MAQIPPTADELNIFIEQGATWHYPFIWKNEDDTRVDITGYSFKAQIRKRAAVTATDPEVIITLDMGDEINITNAAQGEWEINIPYTATSIMPNGIYQWDMFVKFPNNEVRKLWYGEVEFVANITEPSTGA